MRVRTKNYLGKEVEMGLAEALKPVPWCDGGALEVAAAQARLNAECIGRLLAALVEEGKLSLDDAKYVVDMTETDMVIVK